jgi:hypothetical protein
LIQEQNDHQHHEHDSLHVDDEIHEEIYAKKKSSEWCSQKELLYGSIKVNVSAFTIKNKMDFCGIGIASLQLKNNYKLAVSSFFDMSLTRVTNL